MPLNRSWLNSLIDDDGSGLTGTPWNKATLGQFHDVIDAGSVPPATHAGTHRAGGADVLGLDTLGAPTDIATLNATTTAHGLLPKLAGSTAVFLRGDGTWASASGGAPSAHAPTHKAGGSDPIRLDELGGPTDVLAGNVSTTAHGFAPKLPGSTTTFLRGDGTWAAAPGGPHAPTHQGTGTDPVDVRTLAGFPANTATFLRGDGTFAAPGGTGFDEVFIGPSDPGAAYELWYDTDEVAIPITVTAHKTTHQVGGGDVVDVTLLGGFPGGTTTYLRADGTFATPAGGGGGTGTVTGPVSSVVGNLATFSNTGGTALADGGVALAALERTANRNAASGYAGLDATSKIATSALPAHAPTHRWDGSDPINFTGLAGFTGATDKFLNGQGIWSDTLTGNFAVNGSIYLGANVIFNSNATLSRNTVDGSDNGYVILAAGGAAAVSRGSMVILYGNEAAAPGNVLLIPGNVSGSSITCYRNDGATAMLALDGNTGYATFTSNVYQAWVFNCTYVNGAYAVIQKNGTNILQFGAATAMAIGTGNDTIIKSMASASLFIESANAIKSTSIYADTTASAANVFIQSDGRIQRSTSSLRYKANVAPLDAWRWLLEATPITFTEKTGARVYAGLAAEDVARLAPMFAVFNAAGEPDEVAYGHLVAPLIRAVQELHARLQEIEVWRRAS